MHKKHAYKRKDGRYEIRISLGKDKSGKRKYRSFYGRTLEEVEYKFELFFRIIEQNTNITDLTVKEICHEWLKITSSRVKESTLANYRMKIKKHIIPIFGDFKC